MKTRLFLLLLGGPLALAAPGLLAQTAGINTNSLPLNQTLRHQMAMENDRALGERALLPPGLKEKLRLTDAQRVEFKPIEDDFARTCGQYQVANQPRIDAAQAASRRARASKDPDQIQMARKQLQDIWAGLQTDRTAAVARLKPLLTPDQLAILEDPKNQWREEQAVEANDPSAN